MRGKERKREKEAGIGFRGYRSRGAKKQARKATETESERRRRKDEANSDGGKNGGKGNGKQNFHWRVLKKISTVRLSFSVWQ